MTERIQRPEVERRSPIRRSRTLFRSKHTWNGTQRHQSTSNGARGPTTGTSKEKAQIEEGIRAGYSVIEENLKLGREAAKKLNKGLETNIGSTDALVEQTTMLFSDLGLVLTDYLKSFNRNLTDKLAERPGPASSGQGGTNVMPSVSVTSKHTTEVSFRFFGGDLDKPLSAAPLFAGDQNYPPLTDIAIDASEDGTPRVLIVVPDEQPAGTYLGVIAVARTNEPAGTIRIVVSR